MISCTANLHVERLRALGLVGKKRGCVGVEAEVRLQREAEINSHIGHNADLAFSLRHSDDFIKNRRASIVCACFLRVSCFCVKPIEKSPSQLERHCCRVSHVPQMTLEHE